MMTLVLLITIVLIVLIYYGVLINIGSKDYDFVSGIDKNYEHSLNNQCPKIIWTFWNDIDQLPSTIKICMEGWKKYNLDYQIIILTKNNHYTYTNLSPLIADHPNFNDSYQRFSDLIRLQILSMYGGIWIDASMILNQPLDEWLFPNGEEFTGFYLNGFTLNPKYPVIESWFLASVKNSQFMKLWRDEFVEIAKFSTINHYVDSRINMGVNIQKINIPLYLAIHVAVQKVLQIDGYPINRLCIIKAEDTSFKYLVDGD